MNANHTSQVSPAHPAPARRDVKLSMLLFGLVGAPFSWFLAEMIEYGIASYTCRMKTSGEEQTLMHAGSVWMWIVLAITLAIAIAGCAVAIGNWRKTRGEKRGSGHHLLELGEGRSRFLAMCGLLTSIGFLVGFVFLFSELAVAPLCGK